MLYDEVTGPARAEADIEVVPGERPVVRYELDDVHHEVSCRLVVGADGRLSTVRRQAGIELHQTTARTLAGGCSSAGWMPGPRNSSRWGPEGDLRYFVFPRSSGRVPLYLLHDLAQRGRFAGPDRQREFLSAYGFGCIPGNEMFGTARPAGPCAFYPINDSWTDEPYVPGVVLIGDAAGWNDPIIGQGLSIAMRDVWLVTDVLSAGSGWSMAAFGEYGREHKERMRRVRVAAEVMTEMAATFTPAGAARRRAYNDVWQSDPLLAGPKLTPQLGPDNVPAESFERANIDRILALS